MTDPISQEIKKRAGAYFKSAQFDEHFLRLHRFSTGSLTASMALLPFLFQFQACKGAWNKLTCGDAHSTGLRRRYARLSEVGEVLFTYVLVCNTELTRQPGINAPALVIGNFNDGKDDGTLLKLREKLADLALDLDVAPQERKIANLLGDLDYHFQRRRHLNAEGVQITAFDLMVVGDFLPTETLQIEAIPCIAEPGRKGLIAMIPHFLIDDLLGS